MDRGVEERDIVNAEMGDVISGELEGETTARGDEDVMKKKPCEDEEYGSSDGLEYMYNNRFWKTMLLKTRYGSVDGNG
jgi:hypothetical protein